MAQSKFQKQNTIRDMIRLAYREGMKADADVIERATQLVGAGAAAMVRAVFDAEFKPMAPL